MLRRGRWEYVERTNGRGLAVIVIALTPAGELLLVEQFRVPLQSRAIELPAGLVGDEDDADTLAAAAHRELVEETGWAASAVEVLLTGPTSAGMSNERIAYVRATGLRKIGDGGGVDGEEITVHTVPLEQVPAWLQRRMAEGCEVDLKLWGGLWLASHAPDGTPVR
ncbi:NUDIX hydrolase [Lysobacter sp. GX 14042]|uniref:NUDIX hydrolase n=1 Tax=Lysobacter sp. GX 14042 TaxID=2907155 RepID=UPI001F37E71C|nr:NUDIX hydrolase [Lysobacter sp. GX 14042]MCE7031065.1 NUDIX hydrolase [Lysobacter sp. GX 14042]